MPNDSSTRWVLQHRARVADLGPGYHLLMAPIIAFRLAVLLAPGAVRYPTISRELAEFLHRERQRVRPFVGAGAVRDFPTE